MKKIIVAILVSLSMPALACASYEASYTDASGARCVAFGASDHELDFCHGRFSR